VIIINKIKILKLKDLLKYYNSNGTLKNGIDKVYFGQSHFFIFVKSKKEYIKKLKSYGFNVIDIIGLYFEKWMCGDYYIYFKTTLR